MFRQESSDELEAKLQRIEAEIAAHPLASERVERAHAIVEAGDREDKEAIDRALADQGLPSLEELGKIQLQGTASWWRLHRDKKKLEAKLHKLGAS